MCVSFTPPRKRGLASHKVLPVLICRISQQTLLYSCFGKRSLRMRAPRSEVLLKCQQRKLSQFLSLPTRQSANIVLFLPASSLDLAYFFPQNASPNLYKHPRPSNLRCRHTARNSIAFRTVDLSIACLTLSPFAVFRILWPPPLISQLPFFGARLVVGFGSLPPNPLLHKSPSFPNLPKSLPRWFLCGALSFPPQGPPGKTFKKNQSEVYPIHTPQLVRDAQVSCFQYFSNIELGIFFFFT